MNETADELQTTTRRAVVAVPTGWWRISTLSAEGGGVMLYGPYKVVYTYKEYSGWRRRYWAPLSRVQWRQSWDFVFLSSIPCSLCATVGGSFLYTLRTEATAQRAWMKRCSHASIYQLTRQLSSHCSPTNRLVSRANPSRSVRFTKVNISWRHSFFFPSSSSFFWGRNKPIKILLIAPDDGRERSSPRENV